jgi:ABC-type transporter MlaC component
MVNAVKGPHRGCTTLTALALASSLVVSSVVPPRAEAGAPTDTMRDFFAAVNVVLADSRTDDQPMEKLRAIRRHVDEVFDFREAAILALGREWSAHTALEQNEFVGLFADLLERSFVWRVAGKAALGGGVKVHYVGETMHGDVATVDTAVAARDGNHLKLEYRMARRADRWVVRDVVMDGVSTMENYHAQFQRVVRDSSWRDLLGQLRAKVGAPPVQIAAAPPAPSPVPRPTAMVVGPPAPPELDRPITEERQAIARDVAAVVTPGLAVRDVPLFGPPAPRTPERRVAPAPPPIAPGPAPITTAPAAPTAPPAITDVARPHRLRDVDRVSAPEPPRAEIQRAAAVEPPRASRIKNGAGDVSSMTAVVPSAPLERPRAPKPGLARASGMPPAFWIQVGAYRNPATAGQVARRIKGEITIAPSPTAGDPLLRVRVGPFVNRAQAVARLRDLQKLGYQPFVAAD